MMVRLTGIRQHRLKLPKEDGTCDASEKDEQRIQNEHADKVEWMAGVRNEPVVVWLAPAPEVCPDMAC